MGTVFFTNIYLDLKSKKIFKHPDSCAAFSEHKGHLVCTEIDDNGNFLEEKPEWGFVEFLDQYDDPKKFLEQVNKVLGTSFLLSQYETGERWS